MRMKAIPAPVLSAVSGLLTGYVEDATPGAIVRALKQYEADVVAPKRSPSDRCAVSIREYSSAWGISTDTTRRLIKAKRLVAVRVGVQLRIPIEELP